MKSLKLFSILCILFCAALISLFLYMVIIGNADIAVGVGILLVFSALFTWGVCEDVDRGL